MKGNLSKLRPDLPPQPERRIKGEKATFRDLTPPIKEVKAQGPEQDYQQSIEIELKAILLSNCIEPDPELITRLLQWRRA